MLEMKNGFVVTDNDCILCRKDLGERKFLFIQAIWMDGDNKYCVVANVEDLKKCHWMILKWQFVDSTIV